MPLDGQRQRGEVEVFLGGLVLAAVPLGTPLGDLLDRAGGYSGDGPWVALEGGAMMGRPTRDRAHPVTKTTAALLFVPEGHRVSRFATEPAQVKRAVGRSACDQCSYCTQFCPRYLLGYAVEPHRVMRGLGFGADRAADFDAWGLLCCDCGICDLYACPEDLSPRDACRWSKLAEEHNLDMVVCVAAAQRRGIVDEGEMKRNGKDATNLAPGFRISGLGQLIEAGIQADRLVVFGD